MQINNEVNSLCAVFLNKTIQDLYPNTIIAKFIITDQGFTCLFDTNAKISFNDLLKIQKQVEKNLDRNLKINIQKMDKLKAQNLFSTNSYLLDYINNNNIDNINVISLNDQYYDIVDQTIKNASINLIKAFKLLNVSGQYWKNSINNKQLIAINGVCFENTTILEQFINEMNERKERDHRKIGENLELFSFDHLAGQGLPIWLPNGYLIKYEIEKYLHDLLAFNGYKFVQTPIMGLKELYEISGHWEHYRDNMFPPINIENENLVLRPMTCPHHLLIYKSKPRSYKELPFRFAEHAILHRYESSGSLLGLERVRSMQLVDTHLVCALNQVGQEIKHSYNMIKKANEIFNTQIHSIDLSLHDPNDKHKFFDDSKLWESSEKQLEKALNKLKLPFNKKIGEAAFYGPKIDFQVKTALNKIITVSTIQLDFLLPKRFDLQYKNKDGNIIQPVLIHAGIIGTFERYLSILLEQNKGVFPLWLSPIQVCIIPIDEEKHNEFCIKLSKTFNKNHIRSQLIQNNERLSKNIRDAQIKKIPYILVVGDKEINEKKITYRKYGTSESFTTNINEFLKLIKNQIKSKK